MNRYKIFLVIILNTLLQTVLFNRINIFGINPNITIPIVVALSLGFGAYTGGFSGLVIGLLEDILFGNVLGVRALIYFVIGFLIGYSEMGINRDDIRTGFLLTAVSTVASFVLTIVIGRIIGDTFSFKLSIFPMIIELILNSLCYFPIFLLFQRFFEFPKFRI
ncbi:rod shape-determining protein MreD [Lagierella massiliensis]|uniref:rod shape-determining protein MreD n=1 Tax=Lagierella massiliensis TaxID=1689303 RepID=UPI0006D83584|nr:rod shape-determining protein MreD [Lagierella massiliensis]